MWLPTVGSLGVSPRRVQGLAETVLRKGLQVGRKQAFPSLRLGSERPPSRANILARTDFIFSYVARNIFTQCKRSGLILNPLDSSVYIFMSASNATHFEMS